MVKGLQVDITMIVSAISNFAGTGFAKTTYAIIPRRCKSVGPMLPVKLEVEYYT